MRFFDKWSIAYIALVAALALYGVWQAVPAFEECRATGSSKTTCVLQIKYWVLKRYWGL